MSNNVPQLRFPEFEGEWEEQELGNICTVKTGNKDTQDRIEDGRYPFFVRSNTIERINTFSYDGEAILTSGDGVGVGKNYHYINGMFDYHQRVYCLHEFNKDYSGKFIFLIFSEKFYRRVIRLSAKNSVDSVRRNMITKMGVSFPSLPEQEKIATFLTSVDEKLQALKKKKELLEQYKKGAMQKLFSQELRFKQNDGSAFPDWEEKKLGDVLDYLQPTNYLVSNTEYKNEYDTPVLTAGKTFVLGYTNETEGIFSENLPTIIFDDFTTAFKFVDFPFKAKSSAMKMLIPINDDVNIKFIFEVMKTIKFPLAEHKRYWISEYQNEKISYPNQEEQQKIADFLSSIDESIENVGKQIEASQEWKKGLLQKMFV